MPTAEKTSRSQDPRAPEFSGCPLEYRAFNYLLEEHPRRLTLAQLGDEIGGDQEALGRAIANLSEVFLVQRRNGELLPSPLALRVDRSS